MLLRGFAALAAALIAAACKRDRRAPFRHMITPGGYVMSVAMTNCGAAGWVTDRSGYRYDATIPKPAGRGRRCRRRFSELARGRGASGFAGSCPMPA